MARKMTQNADPIADICLYGNQSTGAGYLARAKGVEGMLGTGEPVAGRSMTEAVWSAVDELRQAGAKRGTVRIFAPGGSMYADANLRGHIPYFGGLTWTRVPLE